VLAFSGETQEAADEIDLAIRLNPHFPDWYALIIGQVYFTVGRHGTDLTEAYLILAANYAAAGRDEDARSRIAALLRDYPDAHVSHAVRQAPYRNKDDLERYLTLLRRAGLPD
jgi:adenylate cyclase